MTEHLTTARAAADTNVAAAVQEADEAANLAAALEERVRNGDDTITPEQIANARELGNFAQLRADATRRQAEDAKRDARLADLTQLKADIDAHTESTDTDQLVDNIYEALLAYTQHFTAHNERVNQWRARMLELDVPKVRGAIDLHTEHAHLGLNGHDLYVGDTVYGPVDHKGQMAYQLEQLGAAVRYIATHPTGPRHEQARANAQERIDRVKATARAGARTQRGHGA
ncbi:hypothetical protein [Streptomyces sp. ADI98-10]|uniref:hypothetical protein n=1 Tax=Streptomyces sp. ADI98-10 TaxID=1522763 RepID=UPI000F5525F2|nr:hypothetical protein [Streptomyces sp. ADI98-10]RPK93778.1 hypothetical protein EES46_04855 [Streptomyces sp. ADI98-10]